MTWLTREHRTPAEVLAAWQPTGIARVALFDQDPDGFVADAALFCAASLVLAGTTREVACRARVELHAAACDQLAVLRAAGAGRAGNA